MIETNHFIEHELERHQHDEITRIRNASFPDCCHQRSYHKQLPHFRILATVAGDIVGHLGIDHRMIRVGDSAISIFGIIDLCVDIDSRAQGIGSKLLTRAHDMAMRHNVDFLLLMASDHRLYKKNGFLSVNDVCSWLRIDDHRNYGVAVETIHAEMMAKAVNKSEWPNGPIDLLGYMF